MGKKEKTKRQTIVHKAQHMKLKFEQHDPHRKPGLISGAPEVLPASRVLNLFKKMS